MGLVVGIEVGVVLEVVVGVVLGVVVAVVLGEVVGAASALVVMSAAVDDDDVESFILSADIEPDVLSVDISVDVDNVESDVLSVDASDVLFVYVSEVLSVVVSDVLSFNDSDVLSVYVSEVLSVDISDVLSADVSGKVDNVESNNASFEVLVDKVESCVSVSKVVEVVDDCMFSTLAPTSKITNRKSATNLLILLFFLFHSDAALLHLPKTFMLQFLAVTVIILIF